MSDDHLAADIRYIRSRVDKVHDDVSEFRESVEHRLTSVEIKSGVWGTLGGFAAATMALLGIKWGTP